MRRDNESRDGQPLLHDHLVLSVKVRRTDGQWGTLARECVGRQLASCWGPGRRTVKPSRS
ncbi:relaxase domain-containing protein [Streptomyces sp. NPDC055681]